MKTAIRYADYSTLFRDSIQRGTGKAFILASRHPECDFTNEIISACVKNHSYDGQSENSRASYLYQIIQVHGDVERIKKAVLNAIRDEVEDTWTLTQLFDLASFFAKEGDRRFREAIYQRFYVNIIEGSDWVGYKEIIALDGLVGLQHIANVMGRGLIDNPENWQDDMIINNFTEAYPDIDARSELEKMAVASPEISRYLSSIDEVNTSRSQSRQPPEVYSSLLDEIKNRRILYRLKKRIFSEEELLTVAEELVVEKNEKYLEKMLYFFGYFKFPLGGTFILKQAKRRRSSRNSIVERAIEALKFIKDDEVRNFAIDRLKHSRNPEEYTDLLICNYREGDSSLLSRIASKAKSDHVIEQLAGSYSRIYTENLTKESFEPLYIIYGKMTCGNCRELVVKAMVKNDVVSGELHEEFQYDCNEEIREWARIQNLTSSST